MRTLTRTDEARGLLWLMEEEAVQPGGSEETMLERLFSYYGSIQGENKSEPSAVDSLGSPECSVMKTFSVCARSQSVAPWGEPSPIPARPQPWDGLG